MPMCISSLTSAMQGLVLALDTVWRNLVEWCALVDQLQGTPGLLDWLCSIETCAIHES
jgi:hypothetical protein